MKAKKIFEKLKKINIYKKECGAADLFVSLIVVLALTIFVFFFINIIADVNTRIQLDQVARKYMLRMETEGYLSAEDKASMLAEINSIPSVNTATGGDASQISLAYNGVATTETHQGYGATIKLVINCPAATTRFVPFKSVPGTDAEGNPVDVAETTSLGGIQRDASTKRNYVITKSSTAKY